MQQFQLFAFLVKDNVHQLCIARIKNYALMTLKIQTGKIKKININIGVDLMPASFLIS